MDGSETYRDRRRRTSYRRHTSWCPCGGRKGATPACLLESVGWFQTRFACNAYQTLPKISTKTINFAGNAELTIGIFNLIGPRATAAICCGVGSAGEQQVRGRPAAWCCAAVLPPGGGRREEGLAGEGDDWQQAWHGGENKPGSFRNSPRESVWACFFLGAAPGRQHSMARQGAAAPRRQEGSRGRGAWRGHSRRKDQRVLTHDCGFSDQTGLLRNKCTAQSRCGRVEVGRRGSRGQKSMV